MDSSAEKEEFSFPAGDAARADAAGVDAAGVDAAGADPAKDFPESELSLTMVDLGDDLLGDPTQARSVDEASGDPGQPELSELSALVTIEDQLRGARIFLAEGFRDDARKILHKILFRDPRHGPARFLLREIQEKELGQLLSEDGSSPPVKPRPIGLEMEREEAFSRSLTMRLDTGDIVSELERELSMGPDAEEDLTTPEQIERFSRALEAALGDASPRDRIDLAVAFLEMDRPELAILQLKTARVRLLAEAETETETETEAEAETETDAEAGADADADAERQAVTEALLSATTLLAQAYLLAGKGLESVWLLHSAIRDMSIPSERKLEFLYWLGRSCESLKQRDGAIRWYLKLREIAPGYRDIPDRLKLLGNGAKRKS